MSCCDAGKAKKGAETNKFVELFTGPRRWWLFGALGIAAGLTLGWEQLVFFGIAPLLISVLPCLVMCGLGLCMMKCKDKKEGANTASDQPAPMGVTDTTMLSSEPAPAQMKKSTPAQ